jgi:hypothetical protein
MPVGSDGAVRAAQLLATSSGDATCNPKAPDRQQARHVRLRLLAPTGRSGRRSCLPLLPAMPRATPKLPIASRPAMSGYACWLRRGGQGGAVACHFFRRCHVQPQSSRSPAGPPCPATPVGSDGAVRAAQWLATSSGDATCNPKAPDRQQARHVRLRLLAPTGRSGGAAARHLFNGPKEPTRCLRYRPINSSP